jgi:hypothetical protein
MRKDPDIFQLAAIAFILAFAVGMFIADRVALL